MKFALFFVLGSILVTCGLFSLVLGFIWWHPGLILTGISSLAFGVGSFWWFYDEITQEDA